MQKTVPNNIYKISANQNDIIDQSKKGKSILYDEEFISLINGLNDSIKDYFKVCKHNILETNSIINYYEEHNKSLETSINDILNSEQNHNISEFFIEKFKQINEYINQLKINNNSSKKNLEFFFEDAKIFFKKMKIKKNEKLVEIKKDFSISNISNNSLKAKEISNIKPFLFSIKNNYSKIINLLNKLNEFNFILSGINSDIADDFVNLQKNIKKEIDLFTNMIINNLNDRKSITHFDKVDANTYFENNINNEKRSKSLSNQYSKKIEKMLVINRNNENKIKELVNQLNIYKKKLNDTKNNNSLNKKILKLENIIKEKNIIISSLNNTQIFNPKTSSNSSLNLNNILNQKDEKISELEKEISVYQNKENIQNNQIKDLKNNLMMKIKKYENQINIMNNKINQINRIIDNKNREIFKLKNENTKFINLLNKNNNENYLSYNESEEINQKLKNDIEKYNNLINQYENHTTELDNKINNNNDNNYFLRNKINKLNKEIETLINKNTMNEQKINSMNITYNKIYQFSKEQKININKLNLELMNYKQKEKLNEETNNKFLKQIEELNNNILNSNRIIEEKDELIRLLNIKRNDSNSQNKNNIKPIYNEINNLKTENENLEKEIESLKLENKKVLGIGNSLSGNNNLIKKNINNSDIKQLKELNIQLFEENNSIKKQNIELIEKIKQLTLKNNQIEESFTPKNESIIRLESDISKKNEEIEGLKTFIFKLQSQLETKDDNINLLKKKSFDQTKLQNEKGALSKSDTKKRHSNIDKNINDFQTDPNTEKIKELLNKLNESEKQIRILQNKNKELQFELENKEINKELQAFRTEDNNFSNYEEEFDLKKMIGGARDKNRSEDINIDYPGIQGIKDKYKELLQSFNMLEEQIKILILNININNKIRPQIRQICQLLRISAHNIELILSGKDKKKALGLID